MEACIYERKNLLRLWTSGFAALRGGAAVAEAVGGNHEGVQSRLYALYIGNGPGNDLIFAENVLIVKKYFLQIELVAAISHRGLLRSRDEEFQRLIKQCDRVAVLSEHYYPGVKGARTRWMLKNSCRLIAVWDYKEHGAVFRAIDRAVKMGLTVQDIEPIVFYFPR